MQHNTSLASLQYARKQRKATSAAGEVIVLLKGGRGKETCLDGRAKERTSQVKSSLFQKAHDTTL